MPFKKKMMLIVNPMAGKGQAKAHLFDILSVFTAGGYVPTVYLTERSGHGTEIVREHGREYDVIVCVGGDGTLSEIANGIMAIDEASRPPVGYIPLGTANDVASSLKLSRIPRVAAQSIVKGTPVGIDLGKFNDRYFMYIAAFGAMTDISYSTPQTTKRTLGHLAYVLNGIANIPNIRSYHVEVEYDGQKMEDDFIFGAVTNSTSVAGLVKLKESLVSFNDGIFEVLLVKNPVSVVELSKILMDIGTQNYASDSVVLLHAKSVRFTFDEAIAWTNDGESGGLFQEMTVENCHEAMKLLL